MAEMLSLLHRITRKSGKEKKEKSCDIWCSRRPLFVNEIKHLNGLESNLIFEFVALGIFLVRFVCSFCLKYSRDFEHFKLKKKPLHFLGKQNSLLHSKENNLPFISTALECHISASLFLFFLIWKKKDSFIF